MQWNTIQLLIKKNLTWTGTQGLQACSEEPERPQRTQGDTTAKDEPEEHALSLEQQKRQILWEDASKMWFYGILGKQITEQSCMCNWRESELETHQQQVWEPGCSRQRTMSFPRRADPQATPSLLARPALGPTGPANDKKLPSLLLEQLTQLRGGEHRATAP